MADRRQVAEELAVKDGQQWEGLDEVMQSAYLHNADEAIIDRETPAAVREAPAETLYTCPDCKDKGWRDNKKCMECNPRGLAVEELHPEAAARPDDEPEIFVLPKKGHYLCGKCNSLHKENGKTGSIGQRHLKHKVEPKAEGEANESGDSGTEQDNQPTGSPDTGESGEP